MKLKKEAAPKSHPVKNVKYCNNTLIKRLIKYAVKKEVHHGLL
jgi:hypothetical protein